MAVASRRPRVRSWAPVIASALSCGCQSDHDFLARQPEEAAGGATAGGGSSGGGAAGRTIEDAGAADAGEAPPAVGPPPPGTEPDGPRSLTVVHGVVDAVSPIVVCVGRVVDGGEDLSGIAPRPVGGLDYGHALVLEEADGFEFKADTLRIHVIAGDVDQVAAMTCDEAIEHAAAVERATDAPGAGDGGLDAPDAATDGADAATDGADAATDGADAATVGPPLPALRVRSLALIPGGSLAPARSYLAVLSGCLGGSAFTHEFERSICSDFYRPTQPTVIPTLVQLSRDVPSDVIGLQFLNAGAALASAEVSTVTSEEATTDSVEIASGVVYGEIAPRRPLASSTAELLQVNAAGAWLELFATNGSTKLFEETWPDARAVAGLDRLGNGRAYTIVYVGPYPGYGAEAWWNGPRLSLVDNDPTSR